MDDALTVEALLERGLDALLNPAAARRKAAVQLPDVVMRSLLEGMSPAIRAQLAGRLRDETWPAVRKERGERWDLGWAELTASIALAIELLHGDLPRALEAEIQGTPAERAWRVARRPFQRFVLLLDSSAHVRRVFANPWSRPPGVPVERSQEWLVDGPPFQGRSHTLMLALMADGVLPEEPVAATGELLEDGERVGPVGGLVEKARAWRKLHPDGLLISAPPRDLDARTWVALGGPLTRRHGDGEQNWVVGATLGEIAAKLAPVSVSIAGWDGTPLSEGALMEPRLTSHGDTPRDRPFSDALLDAVWAAFQEARSGGPCRGVVIHGPPGGGKSVLSKTLERRFARSVLGAFGLGVRRSARELAVDIVSASSSTWATVLAVRDPGRAELLGALEATDRLVPIVDGLDELQPQQLQAVADWLRAGRGWWIATSRPMRGLGAELPAAWELRLQEMRSEDARSLLVALGRADLAEVALPIGNQTATAAMVHELMLTPLHTALLARVVVPGQDLRCLQLHTLYERAFEALLDHGCRSGRLSTADAALVKRLVGSVVGELAATWLKSEHGLLDRGAVDAAFDRVAMGPGDQVPAIDALEFGHLLVPVGAAWEFGHRTMAEWAAAAAFRQRVESRLRDASGSSDDPRPRRRRVEVELDVLGPLLDDDVLPHQGRWATLLRFYAPSVREPLALLDRLLGPAGVMRWRVPEHRSRWVGDSAQEHQALRPATSTEVLESWSFAFEMVRLCPWPRPIEAKTAWAVAVRRWLLLAFEGHRRVAPDGLLALRGFAEAVARHLPESLDELIQLAARTEGQRSQLTTDPLVLLPAVPAARASALVDLLEDGTRAQQLAVLEWYADRGVDPPCPVLDRLAQSVPDELERAVRVRAERREEQPERETGQFVSDDVSVLARLEAVVWSTFIGGGSEPPWAVVRRRFAAWPSHLAEHLTKWFGAPAEAGASSRHDADRRRRELLALLVEQAARAEKDIADTLGAIDNAAVRARVIGRLQHFFRDVDDQLPLRVVNEIASARGWRDDTGARGREPGETEDEHVAVAVRQTVADLSAIRSRTSRLVAALDEAALDGVVGELWALLPPQYAGRREILLALDRRDRIPRKIPVAEVVRLRGSALWRLDRTRWSDDQLEQLRQLSRTGAGRERFETVRALARVTSRDEVAELLQHLPTADEAFASLVYEHIADRTRMADQPATLDVPDPSRLSLADRAAQGVPGWRAELLARLAGDEDLGAMTNLAEVAVRHEVREALPLLARALTDDRRRSPRFVEAIALLASERDEESVRIALRDALRFGWPDVSTSWSAPPTAAEPDASAGSKLAPFLRIEDLDTLAEGDVSALPHHSLAAAIRALGRAAIDRLLALHEAASRLVMEVEVSSGAAVEARTLFPRPSDPELERARKRRDSLAETIVASFDPNPASLADVVDLLFRIVGEDVHRVYGLPGALGSDFDEPGDLDWHSSHENEPLVKAAVALVEQSVGRRPAEWGALRRLFDHPSESLRKRAFELCADRAQSHEVAALAIEALDGHVRENRTRWTGRTGGLLLAAYQGGAGSVYVDSPDTGRRLAAAVRARLTPAHEEVVRGLTTHPLPAFRRLAARWAGELGSEDWADFVVPMLDDGDPVVVGEAVCAVATLAPSKLDASLAGVRHQAWTTNHDGALLRRLRSDNAERANVAVLVGEATLAEILSGAAERVASIAGAEAMRRDTSCFGGFPSLVETVLFEWPRPLGSEIVDMFRAWTDHPQRCVREVGRRQLADRGVLDVAVLESLLASGTPAERFSGAECVVRMSMEGLRSAAMLVLRGALTESPGLDDYRAIAIEPPTGEGFRARTLRSDALGEPWELRSRLLWALHGATPAFAEALALVAHQLPFDYSDGCLEPEAEEIVEEVQELTSGWGPEGAVALLRLIDDGAVEDHYTFLGEIRRSAERNAAVFTAIREGAARGGLASTSVLKDLDDRKFDRDLDGLARRLAEDVFPPGWPHETTWE